MSSETLVGEVVELRHAVILEPEPDGKRLAHRDPNGANWSSGPIPESISSTGDWYAPGRQDHLAMRARTLHLAVAQRPRHRRPATPSNTIRSAIARGITSRFGRDGRRVQERVGGAARAAVALRQLEAADALLAGAVEVRVVLVTGLPRAPRAACRRAGASSGSRTPTSGRRRRGRRPRRARCPPSA